MHLFSNPDKMILNPYRFAAAGGGTTFGNASRSFGAGDHIDLASTAPAGTAFSVAGWVWVDPTSATGTGGRGAFIAAPDYYTTTGDFYAGYQAGSYFHASATDSGTSARAYCLGASSTVANSTWAHYAVSIDLDTDTYAMYKNGSSLGLTQNLNGVNEMVGGAAMIIGSLSGFVGKLADIRHYNRAISSSEVTDIYGGTHVDSGLIGWWLTDDDDVLDKSGNGNNGTNDGSTYSTDGPFD